MVGDLRHAGRHLVDGGGHLVGLALLAQGAAVAAVQLLDQGGGVPGQTLRCIANPADHRAHLGFKHLHGKFDLPQLIRTPGIDRLADGIIGDLPRPLAQLPQGAQQQVDA